MILSSLETLSKRGSRVAQKSITERLLHAIGGETIFTDCVLGDLAEEYAVRSERDGARPARMWYGREALRSAPHLIQSAIRHGTPRARARLALSLAALALFLTLVVVAVLPRAERPASLVADVSNAADGVIVNSIRPAQLQMRVRDKAGDVLPSTGVRFKRTSGAPILVSEKGVVSCTRKGDATVRASLGTLATSINVLCRPVKEVIARPWIDFVTGDAQRYLPFVAKGVGGDDVTQLRGSARVRDNSIANIEESLIRPRAVGETLVDLKVGDHTVSMHVVVHETVQSLVNLRADQRFVAVPVHLARGDTIHLQLPTGVFWLKYLPRHSSEAPPTITLEGSAACMRTDGVRIYSVWSGEFGSYCRVHAEGAVVKVAHGTKGAAELTGSLALERVETR